MVSTVIGEHLAWSRRRPAAGIGQHRLQGIGTLTGRNSRTRLPRSCRVTVSGVGAKWFSHGWSAAGRGR
jgi:hypothetical protein